MITTTTTATNRFCKIVDFAIPADHRIKLNEYKMKDKYLDLARELKKLWNMKVTIIPIVNGAFRTVPKGLLKGLGGWKTNGDHPNYATIENIQNTENMRPLDVAQSPVKDYQLKLV